MISTTLLEPTQASCRNQNCKMPRTLCSRLKASQWTSFWKTLKRSPLQLCHNQTKRQTLKALSILRTLSSSQLYRESHHFQRRTELLQMKKVRIMACNSQDKSLKKKKVSMKKPLKAWNNIPFLQLKKLSTSRT